MTDDLAVLPPGTRLDGYVIEGTIARGGFGTTYVGSDRDRRVAIKEYFPRDLVRRAAGGIAVEPDADHADLFRAGLDRFLREARLLAGLHHPGVVRAERVLELNGTACMVMELVEGRSLRAAIDARALAAEPALLAFAHALLYALACVHDAELIHRDLKPDNVLLRSGGEPVLIDFGAARHYFADRTQRFTLVFSIDYAPWEQLAPDSSARQGPWTDVFSVGAMLYEIVTGGPPRNALARANALLDERPDPLSPAAKAAAGRYSAVLLDAIDAALAVPPAQRPQSARALRAMLPPPPTMTSSP